MQGNTVSLCHYAGKYGTGTGTGRKSLGEQTREQIKSVVGEYVHLPPKAYLQKLAHILSKK